ncbi:LysR substrate-binding domain-containing protein [Pseudomonas sp. A014]|uniref:LysR substrate-binding domain-containing protein n=1 Tax=Pseudomonas sp. A014 TaxID=3458058 RepID=UPI004036DF44
MHKNASSGMVDRWQFAKGDETLELEPTGQLVVNDASTLVHAALDGMGIVYMINGYVEPLIAAGRLVRLLPDWSPEMSGFTLYYPDRNRAPRPLRALIHCILAARETHRTIENPLLS